MGKERRGGGGWGFGYSTLTGIVQCRHKRGVGELWQAGNGERGNMVK